jgi:membrane-bound ClpP family serine protease
MKQGLILLVIGWGWLYFTLYYTHALEKLQPTRQMIAGALVLFLAERMIQKKKWARVLCVLSNIFVIFQLAVPTFVFFSKGAINLGLIAGLNLVLLSISSYFLVTKETSKYFQADISKESP